MAISGENWNVIVNQKLLLFLSTRKRMKVFSSFLNEEFREKERALDGRREVGNGRVLVGPLERVLFRMKLAQPDRVDLRLHEGDELQAVHVVAGGQQVPVLFHFEFREVLFGEAPVVEVHGHVFGRKNFRNVGRGRDADAASPPFVFEI